MKVEKTMSIKPEDIDLHFLYKYRELETYDVTSNSLVLNNNTRNLLEKGEIWFSKPSAFNDPFDCHLSFDDNFNDKDAYNFFLQRGIPSKEIKKVIKKYKDNPEEVKKLKNISSTELFRIFCLSKVKDNILMWSHYAKNHTGICIGLKIHHYQHTICIQSNLGQIQNYVDSEGLLPGLYVNYTDDYPKPLNLFNRTSEDIEPFFLNKSKLWEYEQELRFLLLEQNFVYKDKPIKIPQCEIGEIIFGVNTNKNLETEIIKIIENNEKLNPKLYKCSLNQFKYKLDITEY